MSGDPSRRGQRDAKDSRNVGRMDAWPDNESEEGVADGDSEEDGVYSDDEEDVAVGRGVRCRDERDE